MLILNMILHNEPRKGEAYMVRYADDSVFCFQYEEDAKKFYEEFIVRLGKFNVEIAEEKN